MHGRLTTVDKYSFSAASTKPGSDYGPDHALDRAPDHGSDHGSDHASDFLYAIELRPVGGGLNLS